MGEIYKEYEEILEDFGDMEKERNVRRIKEKQVFSFVRSCYADETQKYDQILRVAGMVNTETGGNSIRNSMALLKDIIEDGYADKIELKQKFGKYIADCVELLTRAGKTFEEYYNGMEENTAVLEVKILDMKDKINFGVQNAFEEANQYLLPILHKERYENYQFIQRHIDFFEGGEAK